MKNFTFIAENHRGHSETSVYCKVVFLFLVFMQVLMSVETPWEHCVLRRSRKAAAPATTGVPSAAGRADG